MLCTRPYVAQVKTQQHGHNRVDDVPFPCGRCFHCRINQSNIWQVRLMLEAEESMDSAFITLTFDDIHLPLDGNVCKKHLQAFLKRYRKRFEPHKIRYYAVGEYGDENWRPHYHLAIFTKTTRIERCYRDCKDMRKRNLCTYDCYCSLAWPFGNVEISRSLGQENIGYITGYIKKKATKPYYENLGDRKEEFMTCSRGYTDKENPENSTGGIGLEGIRKIAEKFKRYSTPGTGTVRNLNFGNRNRPIGRYLTDKLRDQLGTSPVIRTNEFVSYVDDLYEKYNSQRYLDDLEAKRNRREVLHKKFSNKKRRKL